MKEIDKIFEDWNEEEIDNSCDHQWLLHSVNRGMGENNRQITIFRTPKEYTYVCILCKKRRVESKKD